MYKFWTLQIQFCEKKLLHERYRGDWYDRENQICDGKLFAHFILSKVLVLKRRSVCKLRISEYKAKIEVRHNVNMSEMKDFVINVILVQSKLKFIFL